MIEFRNINTLSPEEIKYILVNILEFGSDILKVDVKNEHVIQIKIRHDAKEPYGDIFISLDNQSIDINVIDDRTNLKDMKLERYSLDNRKRILLFKYLFSLGMNSILFNNPYLVEPQEINVSVDIDDAINKLEKKAEKFLGVESESYKKFITSSSPITKYIIGMTLEQARELCDQLDIAVVPRRFEGQMTNESVNSNATKTIFVDIVLGKIISTRNYR